LSIKRKILRHEYEEVIKDDYTDHGHLELVIRQGKAVGMTAEEVLAVKPLPITRACLYAWAWMTREKSWIEGLAALTVTEWSNDDRLLADTGGGHASRSAKRWMEDLGLTWNDMPNYKVHSQADEDHGAMFLTDLEKFATGDNEALAMRAVRESLDLFRIFRGGVAEAMERIPLK
ncbi:MAG TPA: iron-containing redox enzyme family protein, partial [Candidatus Binatia bacterium]